MLIGVFLRAKAISPELRKKLKKPLGDLFSTASEIKSAFPGRKYVVVGDQSVLDFLRCGIVPFVAVFDFKTLRRRIPSKDRYALERHFPSALKIRNLPSTVSQRLINVAPLFLKSGGAIRIFGEEDLAALVFLFFSGQEHLVVYGQPKKGMVAVDPNKSRKKVNQLMDEIIHYFFP